METADMEQAQVEKKPPETIEGRKQDESSYGEQSKQPNLSQINEDNSCNGHQLAGGDNLPADELRKTPTDSAQLIQKEPSNESNDESSDQHSSDRQVVDGEIPSGDDDDGDPIPSGTGVVSKDCSISELIGWSEILPKWHSKLNQRPKGLDSLVRNGIPEPLRGEVWQLLSGAQQCSDLMDKYRIYLTQSAPTEQIILRDVHRTYPAHENFRSGGGSSSLLDSLFKVCKAYAVYDEEVGYCQGLSFLVAALLLHMPEEQAFCVFVRIMQHYGLRNLFRNNFDELYLKFYQLEQLLADHMPDLHQHFTRTGIEPFTYASQWFLTVFTAKFPLNAVFYIMDIFLLDGMNTIFQVALALLGASKQELLALDFEGVLKYFRVQMPKRYRNQDNVQQLISASSAISLKKLKKYAKNYELIKQKEKLLENPVVRLQRENAKLTENNLRLEQENDDLARDLVASKIQLRAQMDLLEDKADTLNRALLLSNQDCQTHLATISDMEDEKSRLEVEVSQLKEVCRRELQRAESELNRDRSIISDYKRICSQLSKRKEAQIMSVETFFEITGDLLLDNEQCKDKLCHQMFESRASEFLKNIKSDDGQKQEQSSGRSETNSQSSPNHSPARKRSTDTTDSSSSGRPLGAYLKSHLSQSATSSEAKIQNLTQHIDELEVELAKTKLALVEAECKCQQLTHDLSAGVSVRVPSGQSAGLTDFVKAAVSTRRSPKVASAAFARINSLISEKMSYIGTQSTNAANTGQTTTTSLPDRVNSNIAGSGSPNNNNTATIADRNQSQC